MNIGNVKIENNVFLAPMAGVTDLAFRLICKECGAGLVCTEMISAKALLYGDEKTKRLLVSRPEEKPLAVQIFGSDAESIEYAVKYLNPIADIIDINMGCPAPKVTKNGDGSRLLLDLKLVKELVEVAVKNSRVPITVKMRMGWDKDNIVAIKAGKLIEEAGASAITLHGRTRSQFYAGEADWDIIKELKKELNIPVIGNGDIKTPQDAKKMFDETNVDAIMVGRASIGYPWIFSEINEYLAEGKILKRVSDIDRYNMLLKHLNLSCEFKGEVVAVKEMRKFISGYTRGLKNATILRNEINSVETKKEVEDILKTYFGS